MEPNRPVSQELDDCVCKSGQMVTDTFLAELGQLNTAKMLQADELSGFVKHNRNKN